jgi:hypothetical protein
MKFFFLFIFLILFYPLSIYSQTPNFKKYIVLRLKKECQEYINQEFPEASLKYKEELCRNCYTEAYKAFINNKNPNPKISDFVYKNEYEKKYDNYLRK